MCKTPKTLLEAARYFADIETCEAYLRDLRWPGGVPVCEECGSDRIGEVKTRRLLRCKDCRKMIYPKKGTIFESSPLGLDKWFLAIWSVANCKNGISSHELARAIGVNQKSAWFMLHRIRAAMETDNFQKLDGPAEADTTYIGGKAANMHKSKREKRIRGRGSVGKVAVHGVLQRSNLAEPSQCRAIVVTCEEADVLLSHIQRNVRRGAEVYTAEAAAYKGLVKTHAHGAIDHSREYVRGLIHTNGMENFWSLFKRSINGTYVAIAPFHLFRYVAEQCERFNNRKMTDSQRFRAVLARVFGRRLTWSTLTGKDGAGFMGLE